MMLFIVTILIAFADAGVVSDTHCVTIRNINYEKEILQEGVTNPYQLAIDHDTNTLFYSYTAREKDAMFKIVYLSLKTGENGVVGGIRGGFANAVDSKSHTVYMGGEDGIYTFNYESKMATNLYVNNDSNVWQMFYKDGLYFTDYPKEKAMMYYNGQVLDVPELNNIKVMLIAINKDNNIVYANSSGIFMYNEDKAKSITLSDLVINGFTADIDGNLYFTTANGIYYINDQTNQIDELTRLFNIYGAAIESNGNIIYAAEDSIVRLKPTKQVCYEVEDKVTVRNL